MLAGLGTEANLTPSLPPASLHPARQRQVLSKRTDYWRNLHCQTGKESNQLHGSVTECHFACVLRPMGNLSLKKS